MELKAQIRGFLEDNLITFDDEVVFSDSDNIFKLGLVNSLFAMKLLNFIEGEFNITVDNEDMDIENFSSIDNIVALITSKYSAAE